MLKVMRAILFYAVLTIVLSATAGLTWLRWDAGRPQEAYFDRQHGALVGVSITESTDALGQSSDFVTVTSDSGLSVSFRVMRKRELEAPLPVLLILGGHRTGSDAVDLFGDVGGRAVVALDYPYDGPEKVKGLMPILQTIPLAREAWLNTPPAVSLALDWLLVQEWVDPEQVVIIGASLGVPFAALAAARDERITGALLVHGAADNLAWLETQVARRNDTKILHRPLAQIVLWLAYGPTFDTAKHVAAISPRPVLIIGAREDERTPEGQTEMLFSLAGEPKRLRWTEGRHIEPDRREIIDELLRIADEELPFRTE